MVEKTPLGRTIVALDNMEDEAIRQFLDQIQGHIPWIKIGLEQYCRYGKSWVMDISNHYRSRIFLDLKLHDIPNTVSKAISALEGLPISMLTVHLSGGQAMLKEALAAQAKHLPECQILGVSFLTSLDQADFKETFDIPPEGINEAFERLFKLGLNAGITGFVCSAGEAQLLKNIAREKKIHCVCPGIRFSDEIANKKNVGDQKRVMAPSEAFENGADYLVMGRSLTQTNQLEERLNELAGLKL